MQENIHYMWLSGSQYPSFSTINRFRSEHVKDSINSLFVQIVEMLVQLVYVSLEVQYIDGTKIESVANRYTLEILGERMSIHFYYMRSYFNLYAFSTD